MASTYKPRGVLVTNRLLYDIGSLEDSGRNWTWCSNLIVLLLPKLPTYKCALLPKKEESWLQCLIARRSVFCKAITLQGCPILQRYKNASRYCSLWSCAERRLEFMARSMLIELYSRVSTDDPIGKSIELEIGSLITKSDLNLKCKLIEGSLQLVVVSWLDCGTKIEVFIILRFDLADLFDTYAN